MFMHTSAQKPVAYIGSVREEDVEGVMHQFCEPAYGARTEEVAYPFVWGFDIMRVMTIAALRGFEAMHVH